jgi:hypothetical protein
MTNDEPARFSAEDVIQISSKLDKDDDTFVIGGQATNLWAWYYKPREPKLQSFKDPLTSKDIDYFGTREAAEAFAKAIGGQLFLPSANDMNTPNTAMVHASFNGKKLLVDFMHGVLGVETNELSRGGFSIIEVDATLDGKDATVQVAILHPILCLKSRVANMLHPMMKRRDLFAWAQLRATVIIVQRHIEEALARGDWTDARECLQALFRYLRSDEFGKRADKELGVDILDIIRSFQDDERIDKRYRNFQIKQHMIKKIEDRRARRRVAERQTA